MITFQDCDAVQPEFKTGPDMRGAQLSSAEIQLVGAVGFLRGQKHVWLFRLDVNTKLAAGHTAPRWCSPPHSNPLGFLQKCLQQCEPQAPGGLWGPRATRLAQQQFSR